MDDGHTIDNSFEQQFLNDVNQAAGIPEQTNVATGTSIDAPTSTGDVASVGGKSKKKLVITISGIVAVIIAIVVTIILIIINNNPKTLSIVCNAKTGLLYLNADNSYFIEPYDFSDYFSEVEEGVYEQVGYESEFGKYSFNGKQIYFVPGEDEDDYYADYSSGKIVIDDRSYECREL